VRTIDLSQGQKALVDDEDYDWLLMDGNWSVARRRRLYYAVRNSADNRDRQQYMHCVIMELHGENGIPPGMVIDHVDGNGLNNQKANLDIVPLQENTRRHHSRRRP
jgi:hypothetical protein